MLGILETLFAMDIPSAQAWAHAPQESHAKIAPVLSLDTSPLPAPTDA